MKKVLSFFDQLNWALVIILCASLGLAPFSPPHIIEKLLMLVRGELVKPVDWFDFVLHGSPWGILILKTIAIIFRAGEQE